MAKPLRQISNLLSFTAAWDTLLNCVCLLVVYFIFRRRFVVTWLRLEILLAVKKMLLFNSSFLPEFMLSKSYRKVCFHDFIYMHHYK